jgi:hypothetical protein
MLRWPIQIVRYRCSLLRAFFSSLGTTLRILPYIFTETDANTHPHFADLSLVHKQIIAAVSFIVQAVLTHAYLLPLPCPDAEWFHIVPWSHRTCAMVMTCI